MPHQAAGKRVCIVSPAECRTEIEIAACLKEQGFSFPEAAESQLNGFCKPNEQQIGSLPLCAAGKGERPSGNWFFWILMQY